VAGILGLEEAVRLVVCRGRVMQKATGLGKMAAVALPVEEAARALAGYEGRLSIAAINDPGSVVLAVPQFNGLGTLLAGTDLLSVVPDYTAAALTAAGGLRAEDLPLETNSFEMSMAWRGTQDNDPAERWLRSRIQMFCGDPDSLD
jgi:DNA-binding transcriptional LysR family regulator